MSTDDERDPTQRFTDRVEHYVRYRPGYPPTVLDLLQRRTGLSPAAIIADVGSGTGFLSELFLVNGNTVYGIEPNDAMRRAAEARFGGQPAFHSLNGTAEATGLAAISVDYVTAGQAFHWFDADAAKAEFQRILRPGGWVVLIWNSWRPETSPFMADYESLLLRYATDYRQVGHGSASGQLDAFFAKHELVTLPNEQRFDFNGLKGRLLSSSYAPLAGHPNHRPMLKALRALFDRHVQDDEVLFRYDTSVYLGRL